MKILKRQLIIFAIVIAVPVIFFSLHLLVRNCDTGKGGDVYSPDFRCISYTFPFANFYSPFWETARNVSSDAMRVWLIEPVLELFIHERMEDNSWIYIVVTSIPKNIRLPLLNVFYFCFLIPIITFWMLVLNILYEGIGRIKKKLKATS